MSESPHHKYAMMLSFSTTPAAGERHYLKLILLNVAGATSFEDLRTVNGVVHETFLEAAKALHLIENDNEWRRCLEESSAKDMPYAMRELFATILLYGPPREPHALFDEFAEVSCLLRHVQALSCMQALSEDYLRAARRTNPAAALTVDMTDRALRHINRCLARTGSSLRKFPRMRIPADLPADAIPEPLDAADHVTVDNDAHQQTVATLNARQRQNYDTITTAVNNAEPEAYFLYCAGGTGEYAVHARSTDVPVCRQDASAERRRRRRAHRGPRRDHRREQRGGIPLPKGRTHGALTVPHAHQDARGGVVHDRLDLARGATTPRLPPHHMGRDYDEQQVAARMR